MRLLLRDVAVDGSRTDVRVVGGRIRQLGVRLPHRGAQTVVEGGGGALIPGLHDHHLHLLAMAAAARSVDCGPPAVRDLAGLRAALQRTSASGWVRGIGYHESVAGPLDRDVLDRLVPDRPVRVQHRSGALWMLNSAALERVSGVLDAGSDVGRDSQGRPDGRLWRYDERLRSALPTEPPDLAAVGRQLTRYGITGVTDATPDLDATAIEMLAGARRTGAIPQRITLLGAPLGVTLPDGLDIGPYKLLLHDHDLPSFDELRARIAAAREHGRPVAVHCVTRESLLLTLAVLGAVGARPGDRIEHAAVVPPDVVHQLSQLGLAVVTQPGFLYARGDTYLREVAADDLECLYPYARLASHGVPVAPSSDAPYGPLSPWRVIRSAIERRTDSGVVLGAADRVDAASVLAGYFSPPERPGRSPRRIVVGARVDLALFAAPLSRVLDNEAGGTAPPTMIYGA
ncbi:amidohydrolase family protein [Skermania piniformis]|uniref:amidohydrolase family protein n=1 Tax=Skermania pinensis TaxID=39122 RepID=UPI0008363EB9|nr:amidohydrolase family protein [Skermania piniformis]